MSRDQVRQARNAHMARQYRKRRALAELLGAPTAPIDAAPIRAHTKALMSLHWGTPAILAAANVDATPTGLLLITNGASRRAERKFAPIADLPLSVNVAVAIRDEMWVPSLGSARRIQALMAIGWRHEDITAVIGRSSHHIASARHKRISALDWRIVDAAYERMSGVIGPSERGRARALQQGFVPPLAWNDIDNPSETPKGVVIVDTKSAIDTVVVERILSGELVPSTRAERVEVCRRWTRSGRPLSQLEQLTGWKADRYWKREVAA